MTTLNNQQINEILDKLYKKYKNKDFILSRDKVLQLGRKKNFWLKNFWNWYCNEFETRINGSYNLFFALSEELIFEKSKCPSSSSRIIYELKAPELGGIFADRKDLKIKDIGIKKNIESIKNILSSKLQTLESLNFIEELLHEIEAHLKENENEVIEEYSVKTNSNYKIVKDAYGYKNNYFEYIFRVFHDRLAVEELDINSRWGDKSSFYSIDLNDIVAVVVGDISDVFAINTKKDHLFAINTLIQENSNKEPAKKLAALVELIKENNPKSKKEVFKLMNTLNRKKSNFFDNFGKEFDKNNDGKLDLLESNIFSDVLNKNQKFIIDKNSDYVHKFIKLSKHIKSKSQNLQLFFERTQEFISENDDLLVQESVDEIDFFKGLVNSYNLTVFHAINMVASFVEDDLFVFYEIYETFDELNVFNSNWENEVAGKLSNIEDKLDTIISSIRIMEARIVNKLDELQNSMENSFESLERSVNKQLETTNSMLGFNNLLTAVQTYQMYKINKNTKSLRK